MSLGQNGNGGHRPPSGLGGEEAAGGIEPEYDVADKGGMDPGRMRICGGPSWRVALRLIWAYKYDWFTCICLLAVGGLPQELVDPYVSAWSLTDSSYHVENNAGSSDNKVPSVVLLPVFGVAGLFVISLIPIILTPFRGYFNLREVHHLALAHFYAICLENGVRGLLNIMSGELRPNFYQTCQPDVDNYVIGQQPVCLNPDSEALADGRRSFPCGHCSFSISVAATLSQHLFALLDVYDGRGWIYRNVIVLIPLVGSFLVSLSRITDGRHHGSDVIIGLILGFTASLIAYNTYFAWLMGPARGKPLCVRDTIGMPQHLIHPAVTTPRLPQRYDQAPAAGSTQAVMGPYGNGGAARPLERASAPPTIAAV